MEEAISLRILGNPITRAAAIHSIAGGSQSREETPRRNDAPDLTLADGHVGWRPAEDLPQVVLVNQVRRGGLVDPYREANPRVG